MKYPVKNIENDINIMINQLQFILLNDSRDIFILLVHIFRISINFYSHI